MKICKNILFLTLSAFFLTSSSFPFFGSTVLTDDLGGDFRAYTTEWDPSGRYLAAGGGDNAGEPPSGSGILAIYDSQSPSPWTPVATANPAFDVYDLAWDPAGTNRLVVVGRNGGAANVEIYQFNPGGPSVASTSQTALTSNLDAFDVYWAPPGVVMGVMGTILVMADNPAGDAHSELYVYDPTTISPLAPPPPPFTENPIPFGDPEAIDPARADWDAHSVAWLNWDTGFIPGFGGEVALAERNNNQVNVYQIDCTKPVDSRVIQSAYEPVFQYGVSTVAWQPGSTSEGGGTLVSGEEETVSLYSWAPAAPWDPFDGWLQNEQTQQFGLGLYPKDIGWEVDPTLSDTFAVVGFGYTISTLLSPDPDTTGPGRLLVYEIDGTNRFSPIASSQTDYSGETQVWAVDWMNTDTVAVGGLDMTSDVAVYHKAPPPPPPPRPEKPPTPPTLDCIPQILQGITEIKRFKDPYLFTCNDRVKGIVKFEKGFIILPHRDILFDLWIPHSSMIDLRDFGTLSLEGDFYFGSQIGSGNISGNGNVLFLENDLTLTNKAVLHVTSDLKIDGQGHDIILDPWCQLFVDSNVTLTLKNLRIKNTKNNQGLPFIKLASHCSKLCLDDVEIIPDQDHYFDQGQLFIHNDVCLSGTSTFIYRSTQPCYITPDATLFISPEVTFLYETANTFPGNNQLMILQDETATLNLNWCTFKMSHTGLRLTKGQIFFDNYVIIKNDETSYLSNLTTLTNTHFGNIAHSLDWGPDGKQLAVAGDFTTNNLVIYSFDGSTLSVTDSAYVGPGIAYGVDWSPDSKFIAVGSDYDRREIMIFKWKDQSLRLTSSLFSGNVAYAVKWSLDNKYLAVGADYARFDFVIYKWDGVDLVTTTSINHGNAVYDIDWHPSGKYVVAGGDYEGQDVILYEWEPATYTFSARAMIDFGAGARGLKWSHDGKYLAVAGSFGTNNLVIYEWTGTNFMVTTSQHHGAIAYSVDWSPDGRYIVVGGDYGNNRDIIVYDFDGARLSTNNIVDQKDHGIYTRDLAFNPNGQHLAAAGFYAASPFDKNVMIFKNSYVNDTYAPAPTNGFVWGDAAKGSEYDLEIFVNSAAKVETQGTLNYDNTV